MGSRFRPRRAAEHLARVAGLDDPSSRATARHLAGELSSRARCLVCGRALTDPASRTLGIGPDCLARHYGSDGGAWVRHRASIERAVDNAREVRG